MKLALIYAISVDYLQPHITMEAWQWGCDISIYCAEKLLEIIERHVSDNDYEKWCKKIGIYIEESGSKGITARGILRKIGPKMKAYERDDYIKTLVESGSIFEHEGHYFSAHYYGEVVDSKDKVI
jgi:hypothetical protein